MEVRQPRDPAQKKFGLALGGGGSRAICHLGVIAALEKAGIHIDCIAGNSMGGIIGALYATGCGVEATREGIFSCFGKGGLVRMRKGDGLEHEKGVLAFLKRNVSFLSFLLTPLQYLKRDLRALFISLNLSFRRGFIWRNPCKKAVNTILPDQNIEDLALPFAVVVMNLTDGRLESLTSGPLREPVIAGTNVGVVFPPYRWNGKEYVDAAPVCSLPVDEARELGAEVVLAVDIRTPLPENFRVLNGFDTIFRIEMMESSIINEQRAARADLVIRPETGPLFWGDFSRNDEVVRAGEEAVEQILPRLRELLF